MRTIAEVVMILMIAKRKSVEKTSMMLGSRIHWMRKVSIMMVKMKMRRGSLTPMKTKGTMNSLKVRVLLALLSHLIES